VVATGEDSLGADHSNANNVSAVIFSVLNFPPQARIRKTAQYDRVKNDGTRAYGQWVMISYAAQRGSAVSSSDTILQARLGIAVTKKVLRHAVDRNRFKRIIRDTFRLVRARIQLSANNSPFDIVVVARRDVIDAPARKLRAEFLSLLQQEKLLA